VAEKNEDVMYFSVSCFTFIS